MKTLGLFTSAFKLSAKILNFAGFFYLCIHKRLGGEMVDTRDLDTLFDIIICKTHKEDLTLRIIKII